MQKIADIARLVHCLCYCHPHRTRLRARQKRTISSPYGVASDLIPGECWHNPLGTPHARDEHHPGRE
jgi:hypothetical protein